MKAAFTTFALAAGASASAVLPRADAGCCFGLTASGGVSGSVSQLSDGQNRVGGASSSSATPAKYCINNGGITDGSGRGCILTPPTTQFQCDTGATPTTGFSVTGSGDIAYNGNTQFVACPVNDQGEYNIYTTAPSGQGGCKSITLSTGGACSSSSAASSAPASSAPASSAPASSAPASSAPASSAPSAPASSAPASSAPASSAPSAPATTAPAPSAPASSASVSMVTSCTTYAVTHYVPVSSAPASSAPASSAPASSAPSAPASSAPATSAPASSAPASSAPATSAPASSAPATSAATKASGSACATTLQSGAYQTPHHIVPVNKNSPNTAYGTQYDASINGQNDTIFQFDIPQSYAGKTCSLVFLWPQQSQLETSSFTTSGSGGINWGMCSNQATDSTTYANAGSVTPVGSISNAMPGNSYVVTSGPCAAGQSVSYAAMATGSFALTYFEDWNPSPIGAFITSC